jgi:hypothetical protein
MDVATGAFSTDDEEYLSFGVYAVFFLYRLIPPGNGFLKYHKNLSNARS